MYKRLLYCCILFCLSALQASAQHVTGRTIPAGITKNGGHACGVTADYIATMGVASISGGSGSSSLVISGSFPAAAIDTCGVFQIFYEDIAILSLKGFHDPVRGAARRAAMCAAASYIQSQFDFSSIGAGHYIRMHVDTSFVSGHPAPFGTEFLARSSPFHSTAPGVTNGYVHDYILTGIDPAATPYSYHSSMQVNFDVTYGRDDTGGILATPVPINWYEGTGALENCKTDLLSNLIHEITHTLGWLSFVQYQNYPSTGTTVYTSIDTSIHVTNHHASFTSLDKAIVNDTIVGYYDLKHYWINGSMPPYNHPVFAFAPHGAFGGTVTTSFAHLEVGYKSLAIPF